MDASRMRGEPFARTHARQLWVAREPVPVIARQCGTTPDMVYRWAALHDWPHRGAGRRPAHRAPDWATAEAMWRAGQTSVAIASVIGATAGTIRTYAFKHDWPSHTPARTAVIPRAWRCRCGGVSSQPDGHDACRVAA